MFKEKFKAWFRSRKKNRSYSCGKCGAHSDKRRNLCKPKKMKPEE